VIVAPNFSLDELLRSRQHPELAARLADLPPTVALNLSRLAWSVLVPLRERFGPVAITSGYRPRPLNEAVGGAADSRHLTGCAADFTLGRFPAGEAWAAIRAGQVRPTWDRLSFYGARWHADITEDGSPGRGLLYVAEPGGWVPA
jgi:hypothetical protein